MASKEVEEIISHIDMLKGNAYDKLLQTIHDNMASMTKEEMFAIFEGFTQDLKAQSKETVREIYEADNIGLTRNYAHITQAHISRVDATIDDLLRKQNQMQETPVSENSLNADFFK